MNSTDGVSGSSSINTFDHSVSQQDFITAVYLERGNMLETEVRQIVGEIETSNELLSRVAGLISKASVARNGYQNYPNVTWAVNDNTIELDNGYSLSFSDSGAGKSFVLRDAEDNQLIYQQQTLIAVPKGEAVDVIKNAIPVMQDLTLVLGDGIKLIIKAAEPDTAFDPNDLSGGLADISEMYITRANQGIAIKGLDGSGPITIGQPNIENIQGSSSTHSYDRANNHGHILIEEGGVHQWSYNGQRVSSITADTPEGYGRYADETIQVPAGQQLYFNYHEHDVYRTSTRFPDNVREAFNRKVEDSITNTFSALSTNEQVALLEQVKSGIIVDFSAYQPMSVQNENYSESFTFTPNEGEGLTDFFLRVTDEGADRFLNQLYSQQGDYINIRTLSASIELPAYSFTQAVRQDQIAVEHHSIIFADTRSPTGSGLNSDEITMQHSELLSGQLRNSAQRFSDEQMIGLQNQLRSEGLSIGWNLKYSQDDALERFDTNIKMLPGESFDAFASRASETAARQFYDHALEAYASRSNSNSWRFPYTELIHNVHIPPFRYDTVSETDTAINAAQTSQTNQQVTPTEEAAQANAVQATQTTQNAQGAGPVGEGRSVSAASGQEIYFHQPVEQTGSPTVFPEHVLSDLKRKIDGSITGAFNNLDTTERADLLAQMQSGVTINLSMYQPFHSENTTQSKSYTYTPQENESITAFIQRVTDEGARSFVSDIYIEQNRWIDIHSISGSIDLPEYTHARSVPAGATATSYQEIAVNGSQYAPGAGNNSFYLTGQYVDYLRNQLRGAINGLSTDQLAGMRDKLRTDGLSIDWDLEDAHTQQHHNITSYIKLIPGETIEAFTERAAYTAASELHDHVLKAFNNGQDVASERFPVREIRHSVTIPSFDYPPASPTRASEATESGSAANTASAQNNEQGEVSGYFARKLAFRDSKTDRLHGFKILTPDEIDILKNTLKISYSDASGTGTLTPEEWGQLVSNLQGVKDNLTSSNQLQTVELQRALNSFNQNFDAMSNAQNRIYSLLKDINSNLR